MTNGILIAVEGLDGSGLTTHSHLLVDKLNKRGIPSVYTKEPTDGPVGKVIREILAGSQVDHYLLALLFASDRRWHYYHDPSLPGGGIEGAIRRGFIVVCDRYKYSSLAYQGAFTDYKWVKEVNRSVPEADMIVFIDTELAVRMNRIRMRGKREAYEYKEKIEKIQEAFRRVLDDASKAGVHVHVVKGSEGGLPRPIEVVSSEIEFGVLSFLKARGFLDD